MTSNDQPHAQAELPAKVLRERCITALGGPAPALNWGSLVDTVFAEIEAAGYRIVPERVATFARTAEAVWRHKAEVFGRDTLSMSEVEVLNDRLKPLYAQLDAAFAALQGGDLDDGGAG